MGRRPETGHIPSDRRRAFLSLAVLVATGMVYGLAFGIAKIGLNGGIPPVAYSAWVSLGGGFLMLCASGVMRVAAPLKGGAAMYYLIVGILRVGLPAAVMFTVLKHIPAGVMAMILPLAALIAYLIGLALGQERFLWVRAAGVICGLAGALLIVAPEGALPDAETTGWVLIGFSVPALFAVSNFVIKSFRPPRLGSVPLSAAVLLVSGAMLMGGAAALGQYFVPRTPFSPPEIAMFAHMGLAALSHLGLFELVRIAGPVYAGQLSYVIALSGLFWGIVLFAEQHSLYVWLALPLIFVGVGLVTLRQSAAVETAEQRIGT